MSEPAIPKAPEQPSTFRLGHIVARSWDIFLRHLSPLLAVAAVTQVPLVLFWAAEPDAGHWNIDSLDARSVTQIVFLLALGLLVESISSAVGICIVIHDLIDLPITLRESIWYGLARTPGLLMVNLLSWIAIGAGTLLLILPGIVLAAMFFVADVATVVERRDAWSCLSRSMELTRGHRITITIARLIYAGVLLLFIRLIRAMPAASAIQGAISFVLIAFISTYYAAFTATAYVELRTSKRTAPAHE